MPGNVNVLCNIVLEDEVKEDAGKVISEFKDNGVSVKIISGDNPKSALRAAQRAGINVNKCCDLSAMTESEVKKAAEEYEIFGRAKPKHKQIIVRELQKNGKTVAMIGDGVNDNARSGFEHRHGFRQRCRERLRKNSAAEILVFSACIGCARGQKPYKQHGACIWSLSRENYLFIAYNGVFYISQYAIPVRTYSSFHNRVADSGNAVIFHGNGE